MAMHITTNAPKPYTVLTEVQSESGAWSYEIRVSHRDGKPYCTCNGWTFNKECIHMDAYLEKPTIAVPAAKISSEPAQRTPGEILVAELAALGIKLGIASANAISSHILQAGGRAGSVAHEVSRDTINAAGRRVIILPD